MSKIIALANQKGGCAKTTTAVNLAGGLAMKNKKVLLVDMDPQANTSSIFTDTDTLEKTINNVLFDKLPIREAILQTSIQNLFLLPSDITLSGADLKLSEVLGREKILQRSTAGAFAEYDYVIIDTPPSLGLLTVNSLTTAEHIIVPVSTSYFAMKGVTLLENTIAQIKEGLDHFELEIMGVVCTMYDPVTNVSKSSLESIKNHFGDIVFKTVINKNIKLEEAHSAHMTIFQYDPSSTGAENYKNLCEEVLNYGHAK
ncbi:MAG: ParA family protein [Elusimicrobia bacterium]|nr:ParA family protein [Elusimicrobiota bacterium]